MKDIEQTLIVSVGLSPQVVTETLQALNSEGSGLPKRLVVLTTPKGEELAKAHLLHPESGQLVAWGREWGFEAYAKKLAENCEIAVVSSDIGDIETPRALAELAVEAERRILAITSRPGTRLHMSIAGGRKGTAAILAVLMSIHGRASDRVSHVLIEPENVASSDFFFPTRSPNKIYVAGGQSVDASTVKVSLVDLPISGLAENRSITAKRLHERIGRLLGEPRLGVFPASGRLVWEGHAHEWPPMPTAVVAMLAHDLLAGGHGLLRARTEARLLLRHYRHHPRSRPVRISPEECLEAEWFEEKVSRVNTLARRCGIMPRQGVLVRREGGRARARYVLGLSPNEVALA